MVAIGGLGRCIPATTVHHSDSVLGPSGDICPEQSHLTCCIIVARMMAGHLRVEYVTSYSLDLMDSCCLGCCLVVIADHCETSVAVMM